MTTEYERLLRDFRHDLSVHASEYIPKMYKVLRKEGRSPEEARQKLEEDLLEDISERTLLRNLPPEAKDAIKREAGLTPKSADNLSAEQETVQSDGTILVGGGPSLDDPEVKKMLDEYKKTRDENKLLQDRMEELQIKWKSVCPEHQRAITDCKKCGEKA